MSDKAELDSAYHIIMERMMKSGIAPHYTEIAQEMGIPPAEGRRVLHRLFKSGVAGWLFPNTDYIVSFAPFNNLPTQFQITIDGEQKWFGQ